MKQENPFSILRQRERDILFCGVAEAIAPFMFYASVELDESDVFDSSVCPPVMPRRPTPPESHRGSTLRRQNETSSYPSLASC